MEREANLSNPPHAAPAGPDSGGTPFFSPWPVAADVFSVFQLLSELGVTANYIGFRQCGYAVHLCVQDPDRLTMVSKWLYPAVAKRYRTSWTAVERNLRTVTRVAWEKNRPMLETLAGRPLPQRPKVAEFLSILAWHLLRFPPAG